MNLKFEADTLRLFYVVEFNFNLLFRNRQDAVVWVLLTRHITEKQDFAENQEFITLLVYKNDGKKVYHTCELCNYILTLHVTDSLSLILWSKTWNVCCLVLITSLSFDA